MAKQAEECSVYCVAYSIQPIREYTPLSVSFILVFINATLSATQTGNNEQTTTTKKLVCSIATFTLPF